MQCFVQSTNTSDRNFSNRNSGRLLHISSAFLSDAAHFLSLEQQHQQQRLQQQQIVYHLVEPPLDIGRRQQRQQQ